MRSNLLLGSFALTTHAASFNPLHHLAGIAPTWKPHNPPLDTEPPAGCNATKAAYLVRHAAIYGNDFDYDTYIEPFVEKLAHSAQDWSAAGSLSFLADWTPPNEEAHMEEITRVGTQEAMTLGAEVQQRYADLKPPAKVWASSADRTVRSADGFILGFTNNHRDEINLEAVPEEENTGANSLTPYKACPAYSPAYGSDQTKEYQKIYTKPIIERLSNLAPSFNFTLTDIVGMFELCGYETVIRGESPFCSLDLFTANEWLSFEYGNDLMYYHNTGYGRPLSPRLGYPWVRAATDALADGTSAQDLYVSFTHREVPPVIVTALGLYNNSDFSGANNANLTMPTDRINYHRAWKSSEILPFLTHVAIEKMECSADGYNHGDYYRVLVNSSPQPLTECRDGPSESCSAGEFLRFVDERGVQYGDFGVACGDLDAPENLTLYT
ncbi:putative histidine acid phosphatase [Aspergillus candidus]|uniref:Phosphoglycerate mutase-like protein n=1 Tax=Aspergillus candidus TaxID=41067 RepID=A0A2I2F829_ASPCN|nr:phosphoglycerate mutase-like protein [Aspergillus candidus]PLB36780.1 phosphoglycerate mutase-like protein [Aspergillus candidus]